jgi:hypothetical protein
MLINAAIAPMLLQVRRLLQRRPEDRPSAHALLTERIFQARNTTTQVRLQYKHV